MRNPVGPLPSSIYWRRRVIGLCLFALAAAIVVWVLGSGGGGGDGRGSSAPAGSHTPEASITPGPTSSGPHISGRPGGRDSGGATDGGPTAGASSAGSSDGGADSGSSSGTTAGDGTTDGGATSGEGSDGTAGASGATSGTSGGTSVPARHVPAGSSLPDCSAGSVTLALSSVQNSYSPGQDPEFQLLATNSGAVGCKLDVGPKSAVFTVTRAADSSHVWASDDCPATGSYLIEVTAHATTSYTLRWNARTSSPQCAKPKGAQAAPGTYLVQEQVAGYRPKQLSFVLSQD